MLYLLEVDGMVAAIVAGFIFTISGLFFASMLAMRQVRALASAQHRIHKRRTSLVTRPPVGGHEF